MSVRESCCFPVDQGNVLFLLVKEKCWPLRQGDVLSSQTGRYVALSLRESCSPLSQVEAQSCQSWRSSIQAAIELLSNK
jgi:hypothetical protein